MTIQFEERTFINVINIHRKALTQVNQGGLVTELFSTRERITLKKHGILVRESKKFFPGRRCVLTQKALDVLEGI